MKSIKLSKYFELVKPEYEYIQVIPHKSIRNYNSGNIAKAIAYTFKRADKLIKIEQKKLFFRTNFKISYVIDVNKDNANFYFIVPKPFTNLIVEKIYRYDIHGKAILKTLNKYYMTDLGIAQIKNNNFEVNKSFAIENVVFNELLARGYEVYIGKLNPGEIDFMATKSGEKKYFQVAYLLNDARVVEREFGAYKGIEDNYPKYVLTMDKHDFSQEGIIHKNVINWLLEK